MATWMKWAIGCGGAALLVGMLAIGGCAVYVHSIPRTWHAEAATEIAATPEEIQAWIGDLRRWQEWSAWTRDVEPTVQRNYEGQAGSPGHKLTWGSDGSIRIGGARAVVQIGADTSAGHGSIEIRSSSPSEILYDTLYVGALALSRTDRLGAGASAQHVKVDVQKPMFEVPGGFRLETVGASTRVVWYEDGDLGSGMVAGILALTMREIVLRAHTKILDSGLQQLKQRIESAK